MPIPSRGSQSSIIAPTPSADLPTPIPTVSVTAKPYRDIPIDTRAIPSRAIITHVAGSAWTVTWFSQFLNSDSASVGQAASVSGVYQQYKQIDGLILKVTSPLSFSQDEDTLAMNAQGTALVSSYLIANENDMFIADIGMDHPAVFKVTSSRRPSLYKEAVNEINFQLVAANATEAAQLKVKAVAHYVYREDFLHNGQNPFIVTTENEKIQQLELSYARLCSYYFENFFNSEYNTLTLPIQTKSTYDPMFTRFISECFSTKDHLNVQKLRVLGNGTTLLEQQVTIWDAIKNRDLDMLNRAVKRFEVVYASAFGGQATYNLITWSGIARVLFPKNPRLGAGNMNEDTNLVSTVSGITVATPLTFFPNGEAFDNRMAATAILTGTPEGLDAQGLFTLKGVSAEDFYIFSEAFYMAAKSGILVELDEMERVTLRYLSGQKLDATQLFDTAKLSYGWGAMEQFYLIPLLLIFIRSYIETYQRS